MRAHDRHRDIKNIARDIQKAQQHPAEQPVAMYDSPGIVDLGRFATSSTRALHVSQFAASSPTRATRAVRQLQRHQGNVAVGRMMKVARLAAPVVQAKLVVTAPSDRYEQEADRAAAGAVQNMHAVGPDSVQRAALSPVGPSAGVLVTPAVEAGLHAARSGGQPLPESVRGQMEGALGADFAGVRVHTGSRAHALNEWLQARAFTTGRDIFFRQGEYAPGSAAGRALLAHELAHVVQQADSYAIHGVPVIQRKLLVSGKPDVVKVLLTILEIAAGLVFSWDPTTGQTTITGQQKAFSPHLRRMLRTIIEHPIQHTELMVSLNPEGIGTGAFPQPSDLAKHKVQEINISNIFRLEQSITGSGAVTLAHEIWENFQAHGMQIKAGKDRYPLAHKRGIAAENVIASELLGPGQRTAERAAQHDTQRVLEVKDFETYYLVYDWEINNNWNLSAVQKKPKEIISKYEIREFGLPESDPDSKSISRLKSRRPTKLRGMEMPKIRAASDAFAMNRLSTILISNFSSANTPRDVALQKAFLVQEELLKRGVSQASIHVEHMTSSSAAEFNDRDKIVITVAKPKDVAL